MPKPKCQMKSKCLNDKPYPACFLALGTGERATQQAWGYPPSLETIGEKFVLIAKPVKADLYGGLCS